MTIANAHVFAAIDNLKGFDCNRPLSKADCQKFLDADYKFVARYVPRVTRGKLDLTPKEVDIILTSGLGLTVVQHVSPGSNKPAGWLPSGTLGGKYGTVAAQEAIACGIPDGVSLWCDLEGVSPKAKPEQVIDYCNRWCRSVSLGGFVAGVYVGWHCGLSADELYHQLAATRFWGAYNVDVVPSVRGFQMRQIAYPGKESVPGITFQFDVNHTKADHLGGRVQLLQIPPVLPIGG